MKVLVQRVISSSVDVDNKTVGKIYNGLLLFVGFTLSDTSKEIDWMVNKIINLRIFDDENGVMNKNIKDTNGEILSISQFTMYGDASNGNRPSYIKAMPGDEAINLYNEFNQKLRSTGLKVETGVFGADMIINVIHNGPISIILEK